MSINQKWVFKIKNSNRVKKFFVVNSSCQIQQTHKQVKNIGRRQAKQYKMQFNLKSHAFQFIITFHH